MTTKNESTPRAIPSPPAGERVIKGEINGLMAYAVRSWRFAPRLAELHRKLGA